MYYFFISIGCVSDPADIVFLLDSSGSIGSGHFKKELEFIAEFAKHYAIGPNNVQIGIVTFSANVRNGFNMNTYKNINDLEREVMHIRYEGQSTHTGEGLRYVRMNSFKSSSGDRNNVPNFLIVITDGHSNVPIHTSTEASVLHSTTNIETFAIGIGRNISRTELNEIASSANHVLLVSNHLNLNLPLQEIRCGTYVYHK
jgi:collagen type VI alpha